MSNEPTLSQLRHIARAFGGKAPSEVAALLNGLSDEQAETCFRMLAVALTTARVRQLSGALENALIVRALGSPPAS